MSEFIPERVPVAGDELMNKAWIRYFRNPKELDATNQLVVAQAATIATMQLQITILNAAISTIRDVALTNSLTAASEIPNLGR